MKQKNMIRTVTTMGLLFTLFTGLSAMAERHDRRQVRQKARIHQGAEGGELTRGEARKLKRTQAKIARKEKQFEADGVITPEEKAKLEKMQDKASKQIYKLNHNDKKPGNSGAANGTPETPPVEAPTQGQ